VTFLIIYLIVGAIMLAVTGCIDDYIDAWREDKCWTVARFSGLVFLPFVALPLWPCFVIGQ
jgi:hypothetical protein